MTESESALSSPDDYTQEHFPKPTKLSRRMRPPDLDIKASMDNRAPLREGKSGRRESRLGLGRLFGRHKMADETEALKIAREDAESRASDMTRTIAGTPYDLHRPGSEVQLVSSVDSIPRPKTASTRSSAWAPPPKSPLGPTNGKRRGSLATGANTWDPVPFFQAWPQSIRTATLPACVQADHLLRQHNKKEMLTQINHPDLGDEKAIYVEMAKKRHRRNSSSFKLDWTAKTYILVTSGYLLQYACDGAHDRLPEKVVQLTKDSAAFASDVIPGRHWVLQVSSIFEDGALISQDTRSLFGKFGLREKEKRLVSDVLMIFENAADMDTWMSMLRREIEVLGGKAPLTEIGTPRMEDEPTVADSSRSSSTHRAPVMRDPFQFARSGSVPEMQWDTVVASDSPNLHLDGPFAEPLPDHTFDDNSTTNSIVSQDGRQLDGLRDSANRYSFISAARTIVTCDSSACNSPIRDSFGSGSHGSHPSEDATLVADDPKDAREARLRPNAADIDDRRQSYRSSNIFMDSSTGFLAHRQNASLSSLQEPPNFSLPHVAARRRAASHNVTDPVHIAYATTSSARPPRRPRRPPPPTLGFTRPLSIVADSPSPSRSEPRSQSRTDGSLDPTEPLGSPSMFENWHTDNAKPEYDLSSRASSRGSVRTSFQVSIHTSPRKYASMNSLRPTDSALWDDAPRLDPAFSAAVSGGRTGSPDGRTPRTANDVPRSLSTMDTSTDTSTDIPYPGIASPPRSRSPIQRAMAARQRASMYNLSGGDGGSPRRSVFANNTAHRPTQSDHHEDHYRHSRHSRDSNSHAVSPTQTQIQPPPRNPHRNSILSTNEDANKSDDRNSLSSRRSMPQIAQLGLGLGGPPIPGGPPPAPPPNKALPPIPVGKPKQRRSESIPPRMRMRMSTAVPVVAAVPGGEF